MKARAAVILIENEKIAMIERDRAGTHYIVFPGGKIETDETPEAAAKREIREELGLEVNIVKMVAEVWYRGTPQYYFIAQKVGGKFGSGEGKEMNAAADSPKGSHFPRWFPMAELMKGPVLPKIMAEFVTNYYPDRWPNTLLVVKDDPPDNRG